MFATQRNLSNFYTFRRDAGILGILNHRNQRLQLLRSECFFVAREHGREHRIVKSTIICNANSSLHFFQVMKFQEIAEFSLILLEWTPI